MFRNLLLVWLAGVIMTISSSMVSGCEVPQKTFLTSAIEGAAVRSDSLSLRRSTAVQFLGNTPEPFLTKTRIALRIARTTESRLSIVDMAGRIIRPLDEASLAAGTTTVTCDGRDDAGDYAEPGLYGVRVEADGVVQLSLITRRPAHE